MAAVITRVVDAGGRLAYRLAHRTLRLWWAVRRPETRGALAAVWHDGHVLLVRASYRAHFSLPGGYLRRGEPAEAAAARELAEETGLVVPPDSFRAGPTSTIEFEGRRDTVSIHEVVLAVRPGLRIDRREIVWADFLAPEEALDRQLYPPIRTYLLGRMTAAPGGR